MTVEERVHVRRHDVLGQTFGRLTVIAKSRPSYWLCRCSCGNTTEAIAQRLRTGHKSSCGCLRKETNHVPTVRDRVGDRHGRWTVVEHVGLKGREHYWLCRCDCGQMSEVRGSNLTTGKSKSCGCLASENGRSMYEQFFKAKIQRCTLPHGDSAAKGAYAVTIRNAARRDLVFDLSFEQYRDVTSRDCHYCGAAPSNVFGRGKRRGNGPFVYSGLDRVNNQLGYISGNVVSCCRVCNTAKSNMSLADFKAWVDRVHLRFSQPQENSKSCA